MERPQPPIMPRDSFKPDQGGLGAWARRWFIEPGTPLSNPDHAHLQQASIGWLWTTSVALDRGRRIAGEARIPRVTGQRWSMAMSAYQLEGWFGEIPDFLITIDAEMAPAASDAEFCALIEHELYHCAQAVGLFGEPRFTREGLPVYAMRGHDVEQFIGVVARYGAAASGVSELVRVANMGTVLQDEAVGLACGTCNARRAA